MQSETIELFGRFRDGAPPLSAPDGGLATPKALLDILGPSHRLVPGEHLYRHSETRSALYLIQRGSIKLYRFTSGGEEHIVNFCFAGDWIGLDALGAPQYACASAALEATFVQAIPLSQLDRICQASPIVYQWLLRLIGCHIAQLQGQVLMLGKMKATERLVSFLLYLASRFGTHDFRLSMSRYAIGCHLGLSFETVSRQLHLFEDAGLIRIRGRKIHLLDTEKLRTLIDGASALEGD